MQKTILGLLIVCMLLVPTLAYAPVPETGPLPGEPYFPGVPFPSQEVPQPEWELYLIWLAVLGIYAVWEWYT
jgi:hypothetical protein